MNFTFLRRTSVRAVVVAAMTFGFVGTAATVASASGGNNWYVNASTGNDTANACTNPAQPCATISHAVTEQGLSLTSGTINVAAGDYTEQVVATTAQDNVTILGAGATQTIIDAPASLASDTDTDSSNPQYAIVDVQAGTTGFKLKKLGVNGLGAQSFLDTNGNGCAQDYVGIYFHEASGSIKKVDMTGIDMPPDLFGCQGGNGIYVNSTSVNPATVAIKKVSLTSPATTTTTKANLPANTYSNDVLPVHSVPGSFSGGDITVNGYVLSATPDGPGALLISGTTSTASPKGSLVNYNTTTPAYDKNGIRCKDNFTTCNVVGSTVQGDGPTNAIAQNGIEAFGAASVSVSTSTVTGDTYTGGGAGNSATGILLLNNGPTTVTGNTVSSSDVNIYAGEVQLYGLVYPTPGTWTIQGNIVTNATSAGASAGTGGYGEGIQLDGTTNTVNLYSNEVAVTPQADILLTGVENANIGAVGQGNVGVGSTGAALVVGGPSTECGAQGIGGPNCNPGTGVPGTESPGWSSNTNTVAGNTFGAAGEGNAAGIVVEGAFAPTFMGLSPDPNAAYGNVFGGNMTADNALANVADFSGNADSPPAENTYGTPSSDTCEPSPGGGAVADALFGPQASVSNVTLVNGSATAVAAANFPASVLDGALITDATTGANLSAGTYVQSVTANTMMMTQAAAGNSAVGGDTLNFYNIWAC